VFVIFCLNFGIESSKGPFLWLVVAFSRELSPLLVASFLHVAVDVVAVDVVVVAADVAASNESLLIVVSLLVAKTIYQF
jgi:hypothetical protein